ncbi:hypothetical protein C8Q76DRAFT_798735 [Earliella scabrosa]|nr:hypothetical protein C8Q76DRAFT_798735 [Earliella scabrosa]
MASLLRQHLPYIWGGDIIRTFRSFAGKFPRIFRNSDAIAEPPIHSIPDEVLIIIFQFVLGPSPHNRFVLSSGDVQDTPALLRMTHVCRRWRAVAIGYLCLWSRVSDRHRELLELFVARSYPIPLSLHLRSDTPGLKHILSKCGRRVGRLDIHVSSHMPQVETLLTFDPASLQCLTITYDDEASPQEDESDPVLLFGQDRVLAKALAIHRGHHWLPTNLFPELTHLHLELTPGHIPHSPFYQLLSNTPRLASLFLCGITPPVGAAAEPSLLHLPNLRSVNMVLGCYATSMDILSRLAIHPDASICLNEMLVINSPFFAPRRIGLVENVTYMALVVNDKTLHLLLEGPSSEFVLQGQFDTPDFADDWLDMLDAIVPLNRIQVMDLFVGQAGDRLLSLLPKMLQLTRLHLRLDGVEPFVLEPILPVAGFLFNTLTNVNICPQIAILTIDVINFAQHVHNFHVIMLTQLLKERDKLDLPRLSTFYQPFADCASMQRTEALQPIWDFLGASINPGYNLTLNQTPGTPYGSFKKAGTRCRASTGEAYWELDASLKSVYMFPWG